MLRIDIRHNIREQVEQLARLKEDLRGKATQAALNKTASKASAEMTRQITAEFAIKAGDVRSQLTLRKAAQKQGILQATLEAFGWRRGHRSRNVMLFGAKRTRKGVTVRIKRSGGRKLIPGAFIGNKGRTVFMREGKARLPIKGVETIDVPQMFNTKRINAAVVKKIQADFPVELQRAIAMYLAKN